MPDRHERSPAVEPTSRSAASHLPCLLVITAFAMGAPPDVSNDPWHVLTKAIDSGGPLATDALGLLGTIDSEDARSLLENIFNGQNGLAIENAAAGLPSNLCVRYLHKLESVAHGANRQKQFSSVLTAIRRADNQESARILAHIAERSREPTAAVAFGLLGQMGPTAEPALEKQALSGLTPRARTTAIYILRDMRTRNSVPAFRAALHDPNADVRLAAALGLAQWGMAEGKVQLETALQSANLNDQIEPLVALALLGEAKAFDTLRTLLSRPSSDATLRVKIVWAIARLGDAKLKAFAYQMGLFQEPQYKSTIIERLLDPSDAKDLATMNEALNDGDAISRLVAAHRLLTTQFRERAKSVIAKSMDSTEARIRNLALQFASEDRALLPEAASRLSNAGPDSSMTMAALAAIMKLNQKGRFRDITPYFTSQNRYISLAAAKTLMVLDRNAANSLFKSELQSKIDYVRVFSAGMLLALANNVAGNPKLILPQISD